MKIKGVVMILTGLLVILSGYFFLRGDHLKAMPIDDFNKRIAEAARNHETWTASDKLVARRFIGEDQGSEIVAQNTTGTMTEINTEIIQAVKDDSIDRIKYRLTLRKTEEGHWIVTKAYRGFKCAKRRGHQNYTTGLCK